MNSRMKHKNYTPFFCEENIWQLVSDLNVSVRSSCFVLFLTNKTQSIALINQKAAPPDQYIVWDYHVILHNREDHTILDFDTRLGFKNSIENYFFRTFGNQSLIPDDFKTEIIQIPAEYYFQNFGSDRSHMIDKNGTRLRPFPAWEAIGKGRELTLKKLMSCDDSICSSFSRYTPFNYLNSYED